jgi:hypothetical protein
MNSEKRKYIKKNPIVYTIDQLKEIAKNCSSKEDFYVNHAKEYRYAIKMGLNKEITKLIPRKRKWTKETILSEALRYGSRKEWMDNNISSYNVALKSGYYDDCVKHMGPRKNFVPEKKWTFEICEEIYSKYDTLKELRESESKAVSAAYFHGWHKDLCSKFVNSPSGKTKWTFEKVKEEALKYSSIKEMSEKNPTIYVKSLKNNWLELIIGHMNKGYKKWTIEKLMEEVSKYPKNQLYKKSPAAHRYIKRHKLENKVFGDK